MAECKQGTVIKAYNGYYYILEAGDANNAALTPCKMRGKLKQTRFSLVAGDQVQYESPSDAAGEGRILAVLPRKNALQRPAMANLDQVLVVFSLSNPEPHPLQLDRFLTLAELADLPAVLCLSKADEATPDVLQHWVSLYETAGYTVLPFSSKSGLGLDSIRALLRNKTSVLSGPSGVGKSTLLNTLFPSWGLETGAVSEKIGRGRHTTRFTQLLPLPEGGFVADTPGFSVVDFSQVTQPQLVDCFPEFRSYAGKCRFHPCDHDHEPNCAVKAALATGVIAASRYESYLTILSEIRQAKGR